MKNNIPKKIVNVYAYKSMPYEKRAEIKKMYRTNELYQLKNDILMGLTAICWSGFLAWLVCMYLIG